MENLFARTLSQLGDVTAVAWEFANHSDPYKQGPLALLPQLYAATDALKVEPRSLRKAALTLSQAANCCREQSDTLWETHGNARRWDQLPPEVAMQIQAAGYIESRLDVLIAELALSVGV